MGPVSNDGIVSGGVLKSRKVNRTSQNLTRRPNYLILPISYHFTLSQNFYYGIYYGMNIKGVTVQTVTPCFYWRPRDDSNVRPLP